MAFTPGQATGSGLRNRSSSPSYQHRPKPKAPELPAERVPKAAEVVNRQSEAISAVINLGNPDGDHVPRLREWTASLSENSANIPDPQMSINDAENLDDEILVDFSVAEFADPVDKYYQKALRYGNWVEYTNRVIFYVSNARKLFFFTSVLLRRYPRKRDEDYLRALSKNHDSVIRCSRKLTAVMRHASEYNHVGGWYAISELFKWDAQGSYILSTYLSSNPKVLALLVTSMPKSRFMLSLGPSDVYDHNPDTTLFVGCTHGHTIDKDFDPLLVGSAPDNRKECKFAVHATSRRNFRSILNDGGMRADRLDIHFARVGEGQSIEVVEQLKSAPILIWLDIEWTCQDFDVRVNSNDVVLVRTDLLPIGYILWVSDWDAHGQVPYPADAPLDSGIEEVLLGSMGKFYRLPELSSDQGQELLAICDIAKESFLDSMDDEAPWHKDPQQPVAGIRSEYPDPAFEIQEQIRSSAQTRTSCGRTRQGFQEGSSSTCTNFFFR